jgi:hypothetical protein
MKVEIEIPEPPEGWVFDKFRQAEPGERRWDGGCWMECTFRTVGYYLVCVKAKPQWRPATTADEGKQARFRDADASSWAEGKLLHVDVPGSRIPYLVLPKGSVDATWVDCCEVLYEN